MNEMCKSSFQNVDRRVDAWCDAAEPWSKLIDGAADVVRLENAICTVCYKSKPKSGRHILNPIEHLCEGLFYLSGVHETDLGGRG